MIGKKIMIISLTVVAIAALAFITGQVASGEKGWPMNTNGDPANGGNWMGNGSQEIPGGPGGNPPAKHADWYNTTHSNEDWVIENGDNITRSYSAFNFQHDLIIESGGALHLDSVFFIMNSTSQTHKIWVKPGGTLYITNSTISTREILVEGTMYAEQGNQTNQISIDSATAPGVELKSGCTAEIVNSTITGSGTLITVEEPGAVIHGDTLSTATDFAACIHLKAAAEIYGNTFDESSLVGSYGILADQGVNSKVHDNTFQNFKGDVNQDKIGRAILSYGPLEIYDNLFSRMIANNPSESYIIYFLGAEPTTHDKSVWEDNRFRGRTGGVGDERVNVFKQAWNVEVTVTNSNNGNPIEDAEVNFTDVNDYTVTKTTGADGKANFEVPEYYVSATDDGDAGHTTKNAIQLNPYDIEASKEGKNASLNDQTIDADKQFTLQLDLIQYDYGVSNLDIPASINAGDTVTLTATVFNNGYDRSTTVTVYFYIGTEELGTANLLVQHDFDYVDFDATIPASYGGQDVVFKAKTNYAQDSNHTNDEYTSGSVHINGKPTVAVTAPADGSTVEGTVNITGTASDDVGVALVKVSVDAGTAANAVGTTSWYYNLDTAALSNGAHMVHVQAFDTSGVGSDIVSFNITVMNKPQIAVISPADGSQVFGNQTVNMVGSTTKLGANINRVTVSIDGGPEMNATTTGDWSQWTFPLKTDTVDHLNTLSDGEHAFTATVYDTAGLHNSVTVTYIVHSFNESTNPVVEITTQPFEITETTWVTGNATDDYKVTAVKYRLNSGAWQDATEANGLGTASVTWRVRVNPDNLVEGQNTLDVRAFDSDANSTGTLTIMKSGAVGWDLSISDSDITLASAAGTELKKSDLVEEKIIKVMVHVTVSGSGTLPQVVVKVSIGGIDAGSHTEENVTGSFDVTFSVTLKHAMVGKDTATVKVDPANIVQETNENNNAVTVSLPDKISAKSNEPSSKKTPGFETVALIAGIGIAGLLALSRKRRD